MSRLSDHQPTYESPELTGPAEAAPETGASPEPPVAEPEAPNDEPLEEWVIRNLSAFGILAAALVAVSALAWAATMFGAPRWVMVVAIALVALGIPLALATRSWRRTTQAVGSSVGALALGVGAYLALGAFGIGPAASLARAGTLTPGERVIVTTFSGDTALAPAAEVAATAGLEDSPTIRVTSAAAMRGGGRVLLRGDVTRSASAVALTLRLLRVADGSELARVSDAVPPDELVPAMDALTRQLRKRIGDAPRSIRASPPLDRVTTPSPRALVIFARALRATADSAQVGLLRDAIAADSGFALARLELAEALLRGGASQSALDSSLDAAVRVRDRLTARAQLRLDAAYYGFSSHHDRGRARDALARLLARGDSTPATLARLAHLLVQRREYARAESLGVAALAMAPKSRDVYDDLFTAVAAQSRMTRLETLVAQLRRDHPDDWRATVAPASVLYANGDHDGALALAESLRASPDAAVRAWSGGMVGRLDLLHGRVSAYERGYRETNAPLATPARALADSALFSFLDAWYLGQNDRATQRLDSALVAHPLETMPLRERPYLDVVRAYAIAGKPARARAILDQATADSRDTVFARQWRRELHRALGEVALAEGRPKLAIVEFYRADSLPDGPAGDPLQTMVDLGRAFNDANEPDSAIVWLERFVNAPAWRRDSIDAIYLPRTHQLLAELYDTKGDAPRAISHYGLFAHLWRGADKELLPMVTSARLRLNELATETKP